MKKIFTLIAIALVAISASAQDYDDPVEVIKNGKIAWSAKVYDKDAGTADFANYAGSLDFFYSQEWVEGVNRKEASRVTVDPDDADKFADAVSDGTGFNVGINYCLIVTSTDAAANVWDSQFFINLGEANALQEGDKVKVSFKYKADAEATVSSQAHGAPGSYKDGMFSNLSFTKEWQTFTSDEITISGNKVGMQSIAFNLNEDKTLATNFYFDEISVIVSKVKELTEDEDLFDTTIPEGWSNLIVNGNFEGEGTDNFVCHDYPDPAGAKNEMVAPRVIADPANASNKCIVVTTNANFKQDYDSQLFITVPEAQHFNEGDVIRLRMRVKADAAQTAGTQCHAAPGSYIFYQCAGDVKFKTVWTNFDSGEITVTKQMMQSNNNPGPFRTIALNLSKISAGNNVYFDEVQLLVKEPEDPTIGLKSDLSIAITKGSAASDYKKTEASYAAVTDAVAEGQLVLDDADATKEKLEAAIKAINDAFNGLTYVEGYTPVTKEMFKHYASVETPGEGSSTGCAYSLYESVDMPYGDATVSELNWADLSEYDELIVVKSGDTKPRILMNRLVKDGQQAATKEESKMLDINDNAGNTWSADAYQEIVDDNVFVINLKAIVEDFGFARLHSIKKQGWAAGVTVTDLIVGKGTATSISEAKVAKAAKAIYNVAGQQIKDLQKGLNIVDGKKVYVK